MAAIAENILGIEQQRDGGNLVAEGLFGVCHDEPMLKLR
jgi:hypothetical protein